MSARQIVEVCVQGNPRAEAQRFSEYAVESVENGEYADHVGCSLLASVVRADDLPQLLRRE